MSPFAGWPLPDWDWPIYILATFQGLRNFIVNSPPTRPRWTFDPYLWLALDANLVMRLGRPSLALDLLRTQEATLKTVFPTAWIRVRLLRLRIAKRSGRILPPAELECLGSFLDDRRIPLRRTELDRLNSA